jgi:hypothetical protein
MIWLCQLLLIIVICVPRCVFAIHLHCSCMVADLESCRPGPPLEAFPLRRRAAAQNIGDYESDLHADLPYLSKSHFKKWCAGCWLDWCSLSHHCHCMSNL